MGLAMRRSTRVAAYALIVRDDGMVFCRISSALPEYKGWWTLPGGGLEFGEDPAHAMVREVREETGLDVRPVNIAGIDSKRTDLDSGSHHGIRIIYRVEILGGELTNEIDGTTDHCAWFTQNQANDLPLVDLARVGLNLAFRPV